MCRFGVKLAQIWYSHCRRLLSRDNPGELIVHFNADFRKIDSKKCNETVHCSFRCRFVRLATLKRQRQFCLDLFWAEMSSDGTIKCISAAHCRFLVRFEPYRPKFGPVTANACSREGVEGRRQTIPSQQFTSGSLSHQSLFCPSKYLMSESPNSLK